MKTIPREEYLAKLRSLQDQSIIKVITGVRRCGKSTLLKLFSAELLEKGVSDSRIQYINFEDPKYSYNINWHDIYSDIEDKLIKGKMNYIFLDEVQYIDEFERLLIGLQTQENVDLYVTGSNSHMLSSELATLLSGRSIEISMLPLSFKEYVEAIDDNSISLETHFSNYLSFGGFPQAVSIFEQNPGSVDSYLSGVYETVVGRDIMDRKEVTDKSTLNLVVRYLLDNIGNPTSVNNISDELDVSRYKIDQIVNALTASFLFYKLNRFDIKGKEILKTQEKYYSVDLGLRWAMLGRDAANDMGFLLENIVFLELKRRGNKIFIGKIDDKEVDFIVRDTNGMTSYYQVSWTVGDQQTLARELAPFEKISDYNARYLITTDKEEISHNGIQQLNIINWLLGH
ncbi:ATP-binding protein [Candidatus Saccharibacteria bacterium]|nr:ATP-binding protein [Candidatus Saccharibacteria bacterium]